jgi:predicted O-methyltransferase YrrM
MTTLEAMRAAFNAPAKAASPVTVKAGRAELSRLIASLGFTKGAEIGVWKGKWSARLCKDNPRLHMLCVDLWSTYATYDDSRNQEPALTAAFQEATKILSQYNTTILREASVKAAATVADGSLDFVYVDANHGEAFVRADLEAWVPKVRPGGIISGHDYIWRAEKPYIQVKAAVDAFTASRKIQPVFILAADVVPSFAWVQA